MKKLLYLIAPLLSLYFLAGCKKDLLDRAPQDRITDEAVWKDLPLAAVFLNDVYTGIPSGFERGYYMLAAATDEAETGYPWAYSHYWNNGDFSPVDPPRFAAPWEGGGIQWDRNFEFVRRANVFLSRIDGVPNKVATDEASKKLMKAEARFLRGLFYHELLKTYGGVPVIDKPQSLDEIEKLLVKRNSEAEVVAFIVADLDAAAAELPNRRSGKDVGRASKGAALALKGRVLLYAERWEEAAAASKLAMEMPEYSLATNYETLFRAAGNNSPEVFLARQYVSQLRNHASNQWNSLHTMGGWGGTQPTQNIVDEYEMIDGLPYNQSPLFNANDPYKNRDPRFYATILYDGANWNGRTIELNVGGKEGPGSSHDATKTGYNLRKFMDPAIISANPGNGFNNWILLRLGEVLLNYAEARNEATGPDQTVYNAVNAIRNRPGVNMPLLPAGLTKNEMREKIRKERTVELAFEEHRFFDLRRWKDANGQYLANTVLNSPVYGMKISNDRATKERVKVEDRKYQPKHRLLPIPQAELDKNKNLVQNPGW